MLLRSAQWKYFLSNKCMTRNNIQPAITPSSKGFECKRDQNGPGQGTAIGSFCSHQGDFSAVFAVISDGKVGQQRLICACFQNLPKQPIPLLSTLTPAGGCQEITKIPAMGIVTKSQRCLGRHPKYPILRDEWLYNLKGQHWMRHLLCDMMGRGSGRILATGTPDHALLGKRVGKSLSQVYAKQEQSPAFQMETAGWIIMVVLLVLSGYFSQSAWLFYQGSSSLTSERLDKLNQESLWNGIKFYL